MAAYDSQLEAVKAAHDALTKAVVDFEAAVPAEEVIVKEAAKNAISVVRGIPRLVEHALDGQKRNDAQAAQQAAQAVPATPAPGPVAKATPLPATVPEAKN